MTAEPLPLDALYKLIDHYSSRIRRARLKAMEIAAHIGIAEEVLKADSASAETAAALAQLQGSLRLQNDIISRLKSELSKHQEQLNARRDEEVRSFKL